MIGFDEELLNKDIFQTAFTHRSYLNEVNEHIESNERLEFLGDAVLSFITSSYLYKLHPNDTEGDLTNLRSYIVRTTSLAKASQKLNLGKYLKLSKGEELTGGRENIQIMANTFEAFLGALYFDQGLEAAKKFVEDNLLPLFEEELRSGPPKDAKSLLQELSQNKFKQSPKYKVLTTTGPDHAKKFKVGVFIKGVQVGAGMGFSKQVAEESAASEGLSFVESRETLEAPL
jgi:ribonuclease III